MRLVFYHLRFGYYFWHTVILSAIALCHICCPQIRLDPSEGIWKLWEPSIVQTVFYPNFSVGCCCYLFSFRGWCYLIFPETSLGETLLLGGISLQGLSRPVLNFSDGCVSGHDQHHSNVDC
ncbi:hypothetical protein Pelo_4145 [Pelomyxa schiedti]|nr:hypothetical protein Pelo_4145 [Pelomyxa schiedti]